MSQSILLLVFPIFLAIYLYLYALLDKWKGVREKRPPGPMRVPILGNVLCMWPAVMDPTKSKSQSFSLGKFLRLSFKPAYIIMHSLRQKYGPLVSIQFGVNHSIVIGSSQYAREVFSGENFANRFGSQKKDGWFVERSFGKSMGLIFNNGEPYKKIKSFTVKNLKEFGFGKKQSMERAVEEELLDFLHNFEEKLETRDDNVLLMEHMYTLPVLNILWAMVGGFRFSYDDKKLQSLISHVEELSRTFDIGGNILMAFPLLRHIAPKMTGHSHQMNLYKKLHAYFREILHERQREGSYVGNPKDFIDIFLQQMDKNQNSNNNNNDKQNDEENLFTEESFIMVCLDLFTAGSETTANTLDFAIQYMILNPHVQRRVQSEIDEIIGRNRLPTMADRQRMPYTEATLLEVQRQCNVIPLVHRVCTKDTFLGGYRIKKNDVMLCNLHSIHMDEKMWIEPNRFNPERFLLPDSSGSLNNSAAFLPFGMGKRVCIGESLAKYTLFTFFTATLQRYTFSQAPADYQPISTSPGKGFTICPEVFHAYIKPRV